MEMSWEEIFAEVDNAVEEKYGIRPGPARTTPVPPLKPKDPSAGVPPAESKTPASRHDRIVQAIFNYDGKNVPKEFESVKDMFAQAKEDLSFAGSYGGDPLEEMDTIAGNSAKRIGKRMDDLAKAKEESDMTMMMGCLAQNAGKICAARQNCAEGAKLGY